MTEERTAELKDESIALLRLLRAREGKPGYGQNVIEIKERLDEIEEELTPEDG